MFSIAFQLSGKSLQSNKYYSTTRNDMLDNFKKKILKTSPKLTAIGISDKTSEVQILLEV